LVGVVEQGVGAVADEVGGRLVAGDDEGDGADAKLVGGEPVAVLLGGDEGAE